MFELDPIHVRTGQKIQRPLPLSLSVVTAMGNMKQEFESQHQITSNTTSFRVSERLFRGNTLEADRGGQIAPNH